MPAAALGQNVILKWRMTSDNSVAATGAWVDDVSIANPVCQPAGPLTSAASRLTHGPAGPFDIDLPLLPMGVTTGAGLECRRGAGAGQDTFTIVANFLSATTPAGVSGLTVDCGSVAAPVQGANPNQLLFVVSGACETIAAAPQYIAIHFTVGGTPVWITWRPHRRHDRQRTRFCDRRASDPGECRANGGRYEFPDGRNWRWDHQRDGHRFDKGEVGFLPRECNRERADGCRGLEADGHRSLNI